MPKGIGSFAPFLAQNIANSVNYTYFARDVWLTGAVIQLSSLIRRTHSQDLTKSGQPAIHQSVSL